MTHDRLGCSLRHFSLFHGRVLPGGLSFDPNARHVAYWAKTLTSAIFGVAWPLLVVGVVSHSLYTRITKREPK